MTYRYTILLMKQTAVKIVHKDYYMLLSSMAMQRTYNKALPPYKEWVVTVYSLFGCLEGLISSAKMQKGPKQQGLPFLLNYNKSIYQSSIHSLYLHKCINLLEMTIHMLAFSGICMSFLDIEERLPVSKARTPYSVLILTTSLVNIHDFLNRLANPIAFPIK